MNRLKVASLVAAAMVAVPAMAAPPGGGGGGPGGGAGPGGGMGAGMGGGMGAGPPMNVPGRSADPNAGARDIASQRGEFGREFGAQQRQSQAQQAQAIREKLDKYTNSTKGSRDEAIARRDALKSGTRPGLSSAELREAFKDDMEEWRDAFRIGRADWQAQRDQWLVDADTLTPEQWTQRRAEWFDLRDAWIAQQRERAGTIQPGG